MNQIIAVKIENYRAYHDVCTLNLANKKNILIYGENGSGKTSLFRALNDFFNQNLPPIGFIKHEKAETKNGYIELHFENNDIYRFDSNSDESTHRVGFIENIAARKAFFSYINLLNTHFPRPKVELWELRNTETRPNLFDIFMDLLKDVKLNSGVSIKKEWEALSEKLRTEKNQSRADKDTQSKLISFKSELSSTINSFFTTLNRMLDIFGQNIKVTSFDLEIKKGDWVWKKSYHLRRELYLSIASNLMSSKNYQDHLNEARLSALGLCLYLTSVIFNPSKNDETQILFLDDIFIGLDTSNRLPLLDILKNFELKKPKLDSTGNTQLDGHGEIIMESYKPFDSYQIFITTYDRHWFEIAKAHLPSANWHSVEMYAHHDEVLGFEVPLIMPSEGYYEKALAYFKKNKDYKDYPAAANYLRKECEFQLKRILYGKYLLKNGEKGATLLREELNDLKQSFDQLLKDLKFDKGKYHQFETVSKTVLNPLSHDNLSKPIYKKELEAAFELIENLQAIEKKIFLEKDTSLSLQTTNGTLTRTTFLNIVKDVFVYKQESKKELTPVSVKLIKYMENGVEKTLTNELECTLEEAYNRVHHHVFGAKNASKSVNILSHFKTEGGETLQSLLDPI